MGHCALGAAHPADPWRWRRPPGQARRVYVGPATGRAGDPTSRDNGQRRTARAGSRTGARRLQPALVKKPGRGRPPAIEGEPGSRHSAAAARNRVQELPADNSHGQIGVTGPWFERRRLPARVTQSAGRTELAAVRYLRTAANAVPAPACMHRQASDRPGPCGSARFRTMAGDNLCEPRTTPGQGVASHFKWLKTPPRPPRGTVIERQLAPSPARSTGASLTTPPRSSTRDTTACQISSTLPALTTPAGQSSETPTPRATLGVQAVSACGIGVRAAGARRVPATGARAPPRRPRASTDAASHRVGGGSPEPRDRRRRETGQGPAEMTNRVPGTAGSSCLPRC